MTKKLKLLNIWQLYAMLTLPILYLLIFKYYPMYGAIISFKNYSAVKGILGSEWVGFKHYTQFFAAYDFWRIMWNTISLSLYQLIVGTPFPILLALGLYLDTLEGMNLKRYIEIYQEAYDKR